MIGDPARHSALADQKVRSIMDLTMALAIAGVLLTAAQLALLIAERV